MPKCCLGLSSFQLNLQGPLSARLLIIGFLMSCFADDGQGMKFSIIAAECLTALKAYSKLDSMSCLSNTVHDLMQLPCGLG